MIVVPLIALCVAAAGCGKGKGEGGTREALRIAAENQRAAQAGQGQGNAGPQTRLNWKDVDGDGKPDLIVGDRTFNRVLIFFGGNGIGNGAGANADIIIPGGNPGDDFGYTIESADLNGDGKADLVVSAPYHNRSTGRVYVFYGPLKKGATAGNASVKIDGEAPSSYFGRGLAVGDLSGSATHDLVVSAYGHNTSRGRVYVFEGGALASGSAAQVASCTITNSSSPGMSYDYFGLDVVLGDLDGDGKADLAIGAPGVDPSGMSGAGAVYVIKGSVNFAKTANRTPAHLIPGLGETSGCYLGWKLAIGDVNGDGFADLVAGAPYYPNFRGLGRVYVWFGARNFSMKRAATADVKVTGAATSGLLGYDVGAANVSGSSAAELISSAPALNRNTGAVYVFLGGSALKSASVTAANLTLNGAAGEFFGRALGASDVNARGMADLLVCASGGTGKVYVFFGDAPGLPAGARTAAASANVIKTGAGGDSTTR